VIEKLTNCEFSSAGSVIVMLVSKVHPLPSSIVTVYIPADKLSAEFPISRLDHVTVYGGVPPEGITLAVPSDPPLHDTFVLPRDDAGIPTAPPGSVIGCDTSTIQPNESLIVSV
jgi:hypothetical protein